MFILCSHVRVIFFIHVDYEINQNSEHDCHPVAYNCFAYGDFINSKCYDCDDCGCQIAGLDYQITDHELTRPEWYVHMPGPFAMNPRIYYEKPNWYIQASNEPPYCSKNHKNYLHSEELIIVSFSVSL